MRALVQTAPERLELRDVPDPVAEPGEALVSVAACGICGSDMHAYLGHDPRRPTPIVLGHEAAGTTADGRRVTVNPLTGCGTCRACRAGRPNLCPDRILASLPPRPGAFSASIAMPEENLIAVPDDFPLEKASLAEPIACGWHGAKLALRTLGTDTFADHTCLVIGGGPIGVGVALSLAAHGARNVRVTEPSAIRRDFLEGVDGFDAIAPEQAETADVVVDAVGIPPTRADASRLANPGGVIVHIGLGDGTGGLDTRRMTLQEIAFLGSYTYTPADFRETTAAMFDGSLGALDWIEVRGLEDGQRSFEEIRAGRLGVPKVVLAP